MVVIYSERERKGQADVWNGCHESMACIYTTVKPRRNGEKDGEKCRKRKQKEIKSVEHFFNTSPCPEQGPLS
jgi:hypothetical protein